jgi:hypothetical protein
LPAGIGYVDFRIQLKPTNITSFGYTINLQDISDNLLATDSQIVSVSE